MNDEKAAQKRNMFGPKLVKLAKAGENDMDWSGSCTLPTAKGQTQKRPWLTVGRFYIVAGIVKSSPTVN